MRLSKMLKKSFFRMLNRAPIVRSLAGTVKQSKVRFFQHFGKSHRTSFPMSKPLQSSIRDHCLNSDHRMRMCNFTILTCTKDHNLRTLESIYISKNKPQLNIDQSAVPLVIL